MSNKQIARYINSFKGVRANWIQELVKNPDDTEAAEFVVKINAKISLLRTLWNLADEGAGDMP